MKNLKKEILITTLVFLAGIILCYLALDMEKATKIMKEFMNVKKDIVLSSGQISAILLFKNNVIACLIMFLSGIVPFLFLPLFSIFLNGSVIGAVFKMTALAGGNVLDLFIRGILPHGIFEIPALILGASFGLKLCITVIRKIIGKDAEVLSTIKELIKKFVTIVVPLLLVAAGVEAFVTPLLLK